MRVIFVAATEETPDIAIFTFSLLSMSSSKDIAAFHLEYEVTKAPALTWSQTSVPLLCEYYSCLNALQSLLEETILSPEAIEKAVDDLTAGDMTGIIVGVEDLQVVRLLMEQAQVMKKSLTSSGMSMEIH